MRLYRFHAVGGGTMVLDLAGRWLPEDRGFLRAADATALGLVAQAPLADWSGWQIDVYDDRGRCVLRRAFPDAIRLDQWERWERAKGGARWR